MPFEEDCCSITDQTDKPIIVAPPPPPAGCGYRSTEGRGIKLGVRDDEADYGEFPWMIAVTKEELKNDRILSIHKLF